MMPFLGNYFNIISNDKNLIEDHSLQNYIEIYSVITYFSLEKHFFYYLHLSNLGKISWEIFI